ncbi:MAG: helix-turn-helix transcriptional regulator [Chloroflexi bacterium]|nr:helix-turn-helix transcriptional regulator [Chloroflexota bacterium]MBV9896011.1 helix-turn-helix transcriptional regulator [Chloroflexota bacterium]
MTVLARTVQRALDTQSLQDLVRMCLESLAAVALERGERLRAGRLLEAANLLREEPQVDNEAVLSDREWEVAMLVARGLSNRQIATELVVSERTVDTHVSHILRKLTLVSRAQIAAWAVVHRRQLRVLP